MEMAAVRAWQTQGVLGAGPAPDFSGHTISGETLNLADYRGRPVLAL